MEFFHFFCGMNKKILTAAIATIVMVVVMRFLSAGLISDYSPNGIVSFELAKEYADASAMMKAVGKKPFQLNIGIDFIFIIAYCSFMFLCCKAIMDKFQNFSLKKIGFVFLELSVLVGVLDMTENIAMLITLGGYGSDISVMVSRYAAIAKFSLAAFVIVYILATSLILLMTLKKKA